jgi:hypothetical protein
LATARSKAWCDYRVRGDAVETEVGLLTTANQSSENSLSRASGELLYRSYR